MPILTPTPGRKWLLIDGESRLRAAELAGEKFLNARVRWDITTMIKAHFVALIANFNRQGHTPMETARALHRQIHEGGKTPQQLATALGKSLAWVYTHLALMQLEDRLQVLMDPPTPERERLRKQVAALLIKVPKEQQYAIYDGVKNEKNPRVQLEMVRTKVLAIVGSLTKARKAVASDSLKIIDRMVERHRGDTLVLNTLPPSAIQLLVAREDNVLQRLLGVARETRRALEHFEAEINRVKALSRDGR